MKKQKTTKNENIWEIKKEKNLKNDINSEKQKIEKK